MERKPILPVFKDFNSEELRKRLCFKNKINDNKEIIKDLLLEGFINENNDQQLKKYLKQHLKSKKTSYFNINSPMNYKNIKKSLYDKIKIGDIIYLKYKELESKSNNKEVHFQEKKLLNSKNFEVGTKVKSLSPKTKSLSNSIENNSRTNRVISLKHKDKNKQKILNPTFITIQSFDEHNHNNNNIDYSLPSNSFTPRTSNRSNRSNYFYSTSIKKKITRLVKKKRKISLKIIQLKIQTN